MKARFSNSMIKLSTFFVLLSFSAVTNAGTGTGLVLSVTLTEQSNGNVTVYAVMAEKNSHCQHR
jgi:hypothetical protein